MIIPVRASDEFNSPATRSGGDSPTVAAVVVTRNRIDMLRRTTASIKESTYPITEIIVSDDSTDEATREMLEAEFPEALYISGPRRGISANRNNGMRISNSDYVLLSDDDMLVDPQFVQCAIEEIATSKAGLVFSGVREHDRIVFPNALDFLGFSTKLYKPGVPYTTANQQCFLLSTQIARELPYDEVIEAYGYEEMDFAYRVAASGATIQCVPSCCHVHLAPNSDQPFRAEQDACRLYVTYKRFAYVDRRPVKALVYLAIAVPHHLLACLRRFGLRGFSIALKNYRMAAKMLYEFRQKRIYERAN